MIKRCYPVLLVVLLLCSSVARGAPVDALEVPWESILQKAAREGKCLYVAFLGDGWSMASSRFSRRVLETEAFKDFAGSELIYCVVKARAHPPLGKKQNAQLKALVSRFDMMDYPAFFLLAPDGSEIIRHGYRDIAAEEYVALIASLLPGTPAPGDQAKPY